MASLLNNMYKVGTAVYQFGTRYYDPVVKGCRLFRGCKSFAYAGLYWKNRDTATTIEKANACTHGLFAVTELTSVIANQFGLSTVQFRLIVNSSAGLSDILREITDRYQARSRDNHNQTGILYEDVIEVTFVALNRIGIFIEQHPGFVSDKKRSFLKKTTQDAPAVINFATFIYNYINQKWHERTNSIQPLPSVWIVDLSLQPRVPIGIQAPSVPAKILEERLIANHILIANESQSEKKYNNFSFLKWVRAKHGSKYICALTNRWLEEPLKCHKMPQLFVENAVMEGKTEIVICRIVYKRSDFDERPDAAHQKLVKEAASRFYEEYLAEEISQLKQNSRAYLEWKNNLDKGQVLEVHPLYYDHVALAEFKCCISGKVVLEPLTPILSTPVNPPCYSREAVLDWLEHYSHLPPPKWPVGLSFIRANLQFDRRIKEKISVALEIIREEPPILEAQ